MTTFAAAAPYYARFRPAYPEAVYTHIRKRFRLDGTQHILDLGCGPGTLAIPLARFTAVVHAVDPESAMVAEGLKLAEARGAVNIAWQVADASRVLDLGLPEVAVCTMGRAFGWMDRSQVLADLGRLITPDGGLVFVSSLAPPEPPPWLKVIEGVGADYLGPDYRTRYGPASGPVGEPGDLLAASVFSHVETAAFEQALEFTLEELVGLQFSFSYTSPDVLGDRQAAYEADLRSDLARFDPTGRFFETRQTVCTIATRR
ncbi:class I SAM-dependent methyltransferase [Streptomyces sp. NBC_01264]|uniref:class I SAM-dependent methyltransferase n=1 Tax=Streptomyces sp. NBC_01264 TaxID=2903804 RepID=UPI00224FAA47|nr:class I SAM-dependent methyltransferase [Streptomyces sp. NBC_01264]MCX4776753.1 class I SAM-dependent methyltransferase [Streptomyces sp. NBC_01264]